MLDMIMMELTQVVVYFAVGLIALMIGRKYFDWITAYDLTHETSEKDNPAVSSAEAGFYIGLAIIIHASVAGEVSYELFPFIDVEAPGIWWIFVAELITTVLYYIVGLVCLGFGRVGLHKIIPYNMDKEITEDRNIGVGVVEAAFYVSAAIIIHGILV